MAFYLHDLSPMKKYLLFIFVLLNFNVFAVPHPKSDRVDANVSGLSLEQKFNSALQELDSGIKSNNLKVTEVAANELIKMSANRSDSKIAARASQVLASRYFKGAKDDYAKAFEYFYKAIDLSAGDFRFAEVVKNEYEDLEKVIKRIDDLVEKQNYNDYMKAAAIYASPYLRNYNMAFVVYDLVEYKFPNMIAEINYARAYLYMSDDLKVKNLARAQELLRPIIDNQKDFNLYADVAYLMALAKSQAIEESIGKEGSGGNKNINIKEALDLLDIAQNSFLESVKKKQRLEEPEFLDLIQRTRQNLLAQAKTLQGIK